MRVQSESKFVLLASALKAVTLPGTCITIELELRMDQLRMKGALLKHATDALQRTIGGHCSTEISYSQQISY